jgi:hypothetical protein
MLYARNALYELENYLNKKSYSDARNLLNS